MGKYKGPSDEKVARQEGRVPGKHEDKDIPKPPRYSDQCKVLSTVNYKQCKMDQCENPMHESNKGTRRLKVLL